jgi:hypothetical protein
MSLSSSVRARSESSSATLTACIGHVAACRICCGYTDGFSTGPWQLRVAAAASDDSSDDVAGLELGLTFLQGHRENANTERFCSVGLAQVELRSARHSIKHFRIRPQTSSDDAIAGQMCWH